jgi:deoxyribodipyrimidine photo-lyase
MSAEAAKHAVLVWLRNDLRLADNPALHAAIATGSPIVPVFLWSPDEEGPCAPGAASRWWLHQSLNVLADELAQRASRLIVRSGPSAETLLRIAKESGAKSVYWNRRYEPTIITRDKQVKSLLRKRGLTATSFPGNLLYEPWTIQNTSGRPFQVFTAFWRAWLSEPAPSAPECAPDRIPAPVRWPSSQGIAELELEPKIDWANGLREVWRPGERGAAHQLKTFLSDAMANYPDGRNRPGNAGTSRLSPHLHFGEITSRQIWHEVQMHAARGGGHIGRSAEVYLREIAWREFAHHLLFHFPQTPREPLHKEFRDFPWQRDKRSFGAWTKGQTGYPMVDAGMRELWHTGWMHNRARMIVASFLVKHLLIRWQDGAAWFWDTLVDADLANNTLGWQWTAGCGADAAPYFRIFNPVLQGEKFDRDGDYVRRWVPEIARLPNQWIHKPWKAPAPVLKAAGITLEKTYPRPIVDHEMARKRALEAFAAMRRQR